MTNYQTGKCELCNIEFPRKQLKRINKKWRCSKCYINKKGENREHLKRDILGIRKRSDLVIEWKKKREESERLRKIVSPTVPKIKGQRIKRISKQLHFYLTSVEKQFLFRKYQSMGLCNLEMKERIENDTKYLNDLIKELKEKNKTDEEINKTFKENFSKMIMENDSEEIEMKGGLK